jgi:hypothetical protein
MFMQLNKLIISHSKFKEFKSLTNMINFILHNSRRKNGRFNKTEFLIRKVLKLLKTFFFILFVGKDMWTWQSKNPLGFSKS